MCTVLKFNVNYRKAALFFYPMQGAAGKIWQGGFLHEL